jgi:NADP-dependent 3-hydroxy acid dehydrogenase YdfG
LRATPGSSLRIQTLTNTPPANGGKALALQIDVTHVDQVKRLVDTAVQTFGRINVMINNAGLMPQSLLENLKVDDWYSTGLLPREADHRHITPQ